jgi:hypothetical protein
MEAIALGGSGAELLRDPGEATQVRHEYGHPPLLTPQGEPLGGLQEAGYDLVAQISAEGLLDESVPDPEPFRQPHGVGQPVALLVGQLQAAPRLDADGGPWRVQPVRQPFGVTHEARGARILAQTNQDALAGRPGAGDGIGLHVGEQLLIHPLGGTPQCQFA